MPTGVLAYERGSSSCAGALRGASATRASATAAANDFIAAIQGPLRRRARATSPVIRMAAYSIVVGQRRAQLRLTASRYTAMDDDLDRMTRDQLIDEVRKL